MKVEREVARWGFQVIKLLYGVGKWFLVNFSNEIGDDFNEIGDILEMTIFIIFLTKLWNFQKRKIN